jgi:phosphohistidine phosphatase SixA
MSNRLCAVTGGGRRAPLTDAQIAQAAGVRTARRVGLAMALVLAPAHLPAVANGQASPQLWELLRGGGQVVLIRHAITTPGVGDPPGFRLDDCSTQRNLTEAGRQDARRIGAAFQARGVPVGDVLSSPWCRCMETAQLAFGRAVPWVPLSNLFGARNREAEQVSAMRERVGERPTSGNLILVSHGSTIRALTGVQPAPSEMVVVTPEGRGRFRIAGRVPLEALESAR